MLRSPKLLHPVDAVASFDCNPPPLSAYREQNIVRKPIGLRLSYPGSPVRAASASASRAPSATGSGAQAEPRRPFDLRFMAGDSKPLKEQYVHSHMKLPLRKTEGFLKTYLKVLEGREGAREWGGHRKEWGEKERMRCRVLLAIDMWTLLAI